MNWRASSGVQSMLIVTFMDLNLPSQSLYRRESPGRQAALTTPLA